MTDNLYDCLLPDTVDPTRIALQPEAGPAWTFGGLKDLSSRMRTTMVEAGLSRGDRIAVQAEKTPETVCLYLACLAAGIAYIPLNTGYTATEVAYILEDAKPAAFVGTCATITALENSGALGGRVAFSVEPDGTGTLSDTAARARQSAAGADPSGQDIAAILYTSGTTGRPKGAVLTHANLIFSTGALVSAWDVGSDDVLLHALPIFHAHGLFIALNTALRAGAETIFLPKFTNDGVIKHLPDATMFMGVPTFYSRLLSDERFDAGLVARMRLFTCGSAPLPASMHQEFFARTGHTILERYGMTETIIIASNPLEGERVAGTVGFALPGVEVRILDPEGRALGTDGVGELVLRGPNVFQSYWGAPDKTAAEFTWDGYFKTGDLASIAADGRITIVGRAKDMIISGGFNVYPQEIEDALRRIDCVQDAAVFGVPHLDFGEGVVAAIELKAGHELPSTSELTRKLSENLARYKIPKVYIPLPSLPRNALGKVQKVELRQSYAGAFAAGIHPF